MIQRIIYIVNIMSQNINQIKGQAYENFVLKHIQNQYDQIWLWSNVPEKILLEHSIIENYNVYCKNRISNRKDIGIDIVGIKSGKLYFIQCKNYENNVCVNDIAGFLWFLLTYSVDGILFYSNGISQNIVNTLAERYDRMKIKIDHIHLPFHTILPAVVQQIAIQPYEYQLNAAQEFEHVNKMILSVPCGVGKTYTATLIAQKYDNILLIAPLRELTNDLLATFGNHMGNDYKTILISCDGTRDPIIIAKRLSHKNIIASTFKSVDILQQIAKNLPNKIVVIDEFHNLSEKNITDQNDPMYRIIHRATKILYLSATPILNVPHEKLFKYDWNEAISKNYICDFNITIPSSSIICEENLNNMIELLKDVKNVDDKMIKKGYFIVKSLLYNGNRKCIVYSVTIDKATIFKKIIDGLSKLLNIEIDCDVISCETSLEARKKILFSFKNSDKLFVLVNVHVLDEGINIPECDSVFITRPNDNIINLVQRLCRCNRITENKKKCNMYIWCKEKKIKNVFEYLENNVMSDINNKINVYNSNSNASNKKILSKINESTNIVTRQHSDRTLPNDHINTFNINEILNDPNPSNTDPKINFNIIIKLFDVQKGHLKRLLVAKFKKETDYIIKSDKVLNTNNRGANYVETILLTPFCFKKLYMISQANKVKVLKLS